MTRIAKTAGLWAALAATVWMPQSGWAQSHLADRVQAAVDAMEVACAADVARYCGSVTRAEGRVLTCLQAFDDQLSRRCQFGLYRASRNLERSLDRVERIADACWSEIEANCANADKVGQCLMEKAASLSPSCRSVLDGIRQTLHNLASLRGLPVYSSDNEELGKVAEVVRDGNGNVQALRIDIGRFLGVGARMVSIDANSFDELADKIRLRITGEAMRAAPDATRQ
jgi:sporulation protein YlmC with PRC-barrel domain